MVTSTQLTVYILLKYALAGCRWISCNTQTMRPQVSGGGKGQTKPEVVGQEKVGESHVTHDVHASPTIHAVTYKTTTAGTVPLAVAQVETARVSTAAAIVLQCKHTYIAL